MEIDYDARYEHPDYKGVALYISGPVIDHIEPYPTYDDDEYYWLGCERALYHENECDCPESDTEVLVIMVGDDREFHVNFEDLTPIADDDYCGTCGQIGCGHG